MEANPEENKVFWEFIEAERNAMLKTYEFGTHPCDVEIAVQGSDSEGDWWESQLLFIRRRADDRAHNMAFNLTGFRFAAPGTLAVRYMHTVI